MAIELQLSVNTMVMGQSIHLFVSVNTQERQLITHGL